MQLERETGTRSQFLEGDVPAETRPASVFVSDASSVSAPPPTHLSFPLKGLLAPHHASQGCPPPPQQPLPSACYNGVLGRSPRPPHACTMLLSPALWLAGNENLALSVAVPLLLRVTVEREGHCQPGRWRRGGQGLQGRVPGDWSVRGGGSNPRSCNISQEQTRAHALSPSSSLFPFVMLSCCLPPSLPPMPSNISILTPVSPLLSPRPSPSPSHPSFFHRPKP